MAIVQNLLIGRAKGRVGNVVFSTHKNKNILKAKAEIVANPRSGQQQANRSRFTALLALGRLLRPIIQIGFKEYASSVSWLNRFMSTNSYSDVMVWDENEQSWTVDYSKVVIAEGSLYPTAPGITALVGSDFTINYNSSNLSNQNSEDRVFAVAFSQSETVYSMDQALRSDGSVSLHFDTAPANGTKIYYAFYFRSPDGLIVSNSFSGGFTIAN